MLKRYVLFLAVLVIALSVPQQVLAEGQTWGNDVLVHQANHIYGFGMDQGDKDTLLLVVSDSSTTNLKDTLYLYRSTDNGQTWNCVRTATSGTNDLRFGKADIIAAKGDTNFVFVFWIWDNELWYCKYNYGDLSVRFCTTIDNDNVVDFSVCQDLWSNYWLYVVYQTDQDSVIFKTSRDYGQTWKFKKNLTEVTPITSQPSIAWSRGTYLVVAGKTDDDKIYTIRNDNSGYSADWKDGQYPWAGSDCDAPVVAGSHTTPSAEAVFWVFYERYSTTPPAHWVLNFHWSTDAGASWFILSSPSDTSSGNRLYPSLHVLKENDAQNITLAYRYEGTSPRQIRYIYKENGQANPSVWTAPYSGINDHSPHHTPPQRAYTIRGTDNSVQSAVLYVHWTEHDLYFDASSFVGVDDEIGNEVIREFSLKQNYPNPFNPGTVIEYELAQAGWISMEIYNVLGQRVRQLFNGHAVRGHHRITWDGKDDNGKVVANGIYFYRIQAGDFTETKKMILLK